MKNTVKRIYFEEITSCTLSKVNPVPIFEMEDGSTRIPYDYYGQMIWLAENEILEYDRKKREKDKIKRHMCIF